ncbi:hypothetical protein [Cognatiluteimonas telluris]|jgi:hypothetical protein|uniref:hypothetical protein n=1 Tax=Cognatiluteimonas telluris TaxID=1104775 RepID=UPI00140D5C9B|nr:hypothetical protein [Lysobacter telluris]
MRTPSRSFVLLVAAVGLTTLLVHAAQRPSQRTESAEPVSTDLPQTPQQRRLSAHAALKVAVPRTGTMVTDDEVGDSDSFGRNVTWLGVTSAFINLGSPCDPADATPCQDLLPSGSLTMFEFNDAASLSLPAKASHSLLCYWFSPVLSVQYDNPGPSPVVARLTYSPTLTVENPVLADPALIDPTTGVAFNGSLLTSMTSSEHIEVPLAAGMQLFQRTRTSTVCMAGLLSHKALVETYGLTATQADDFFKSPTKIRLNVSGSSRYVSAASFVFGLRVVGD